MDNTKIITVTNQKGGVGKTATAVNLAASFASQGKVTLLIDLDYQANATAYLGLKRKAKQDGELISRVIRDEASIEECLTDTGIDNLYCCGGDMALSKLSQQLAGDPGAETILRSHLEDIRGPGNAAEIVIIDTHPSLDLLFQMALTASDYYLVPMFAEADPFDGMQYLFEEVQKIGRRLNPALHFLGLVVTKFDKTHSTHKKFFELLESFCDANDMPIQGVVPDSKAVATSASLSVPLVQYKPHLEAAQAYTRLAERIVEYIMIDECQKAMQIPRPNLTAPTIKGTPDGFEELFAEDVEL